MSQYGSNPPPGVIRITKDEANDPHVDDLIKRQMSLRGESGITHDRKRKWYLQNWFLFMIAGTVAAIGGWAIVEPFLYDLPYYQGTLTEINLSPDPTASPFEDPNSRAPGDQPAVRRGHQPDPRLKPDAPPDVIMPYVKINEQKVYILPHLRLITPDGQNVKLEPGMWKPKLGDEVGVYLERVPTTDSGGTV